MSGSPIKDPSARRRRNVPKRGEFKDAPGVGWQHGRKPRAPDGLMPDSLAAWHTWFASWYAAFWTPADIPALRLLIKLYDVVERGEVRHQGELRAWLDAYGITPKGQQDRRWKPPETDRGDRGHQAQGLQAPTASSRRWNDDRTEARDYEFETYQREDGKWAWRLVAPNGRVIATDAGQGFRDRTDAERSISLVRIAAGSKKLQDAGDKKWRKPEYEGEYPTLGWAVLDWTAAPTCPAPPMSASRSSSRWSRPNGCSSGSGCTRSPASSTTRC